MSSINTNEKLDAGLVLVLAILAVGFAMSWFLSKVVSIDEEGEEEST